MRDMCELDEFVNRFRAVRDDATHIQLRNDLIEHLAATWEAVCDKRLVYSSFEYITSLLSTPLLDFIGL